MSDFVHVAATQHGLATAMADARGRRYRKAGLSSGLAAALCVVALVAGAGGTQTLLQEPAPAIPAVTGIHPAQDVAPRQNTTSLTTTGRPLTPTQRSPLPVPAAATPSSRAPSVGGSTQSTYRAGAITRDDGMLTLVNCGVDESAQQPQRLCSSASIGQYPDAWQMVAQVCSTRTETTDLHYAQRDEVDFVVTRKGDELWRWSAWHPAVARPHVVRVETGTCTDWTFDWTGVDASGRKLPSGDYTLRALFLADELAAEPVALTAFTIT